MNSIATLRIPVSPIAMPVDRAKYLHARLPVAWPPRKPKVIVKRKNLFLRSLSAACMEKLEPSLRTVSLRREQYLWDQGETPEYVYFPETAVISHLKMLEDGRIVEVALTGREGSAGMTSIFGSGVSASSAQVAQAGLAVRIEREVLQKMTRICPELVPSLLADIGPYINDVSQRSVCNMYHDVKQRFATWLLMIHDRCRADILNLTHEQIARSLGIYRPSLTSIAIELRMNGSIEYSRGAVTIRDRAMLEGEACTCYTKLSIVH